MENNRYPRVLVISNNCFRSSGSNGKVLQELFDGWDIEAIAQFYVYDEMPDFFVCKNYFRVTDREAVRSFFGNKQCGNIVQPIKTKEINNSGTVKNSGIQRNPLTCLIRDIVWNFGGWKNKKFWNWIEAFSPQLILLQIGDSSFMPNLALKISKKLNIPIAFYCTENYYFKKHNYFLGAGGTKYGVFYPIFRRGIVSSFKKLMKKSCCQIYNSSQLERLYRKEFGKQGEIIYQSTSLNYKPKITANQVLKFSYTGNLGLNRHKSLIEIANVLQQISTKYYLDVYGSATEAVILELQNTVGIKYHGVVGYDKVLEVIDESDILFHAESFDEYIVKDLETAFSTKISDCLASGRCLVLYADKSLACSQYLLENDCACVITEQSFLFDKIKELIGSEKLQCHYINNAKKIVEKNHDIKRNSEEFKDILKSLILN